MRSLEEIKHQIKGEKNKSEIFIEREVLVGCPGIYSGVGRLGL